MPHVASYGYARSCIVHTVLTAKEDSESARAACSYMAMQDHHVLSIQFLQPEVELATFQMKALFPSGHL